ncbi:MAG: hypothetical protein ACRYFX_26385 [Janthinobacterium lividum]
MSTTPSNDPATQAEGGTPQYGAFGKPEDAAAAGSTTKNDGSNDNPDEFSEFRKPGAPATEDYSADASTASPSAQRGHSPQNQDPGAVQATQNQDNDVKQAAWADDDPRWKGGHEKPTWQEENAKEHGTNQ